jgi:hypothetical protein
VSWCESAVFFKSLLSLHDCYHVVNHNQVVKLVDVERGRVSGQPVLVGQVAGSVHW